MQHSMFTGRYDGFTVVTCSGTDALSPAAAGFYSQGPPGPPEVFLPVIKESAKLCLSNMTTFSSPSDGLVPNHRDRILAGLFR